jgi:hypothetical protein
MPFYGFYSIVLCITQNVMHKRKRAREESEEEKKEEHDALKPKKPRQQIEKKGTEEDSERKKKESKSSRVQQTEAERLASTQAMSVKMVAVRNARGKSDVITDLALRKKFVGSQNKQITRHSSLLQTRADVISCTFTIDINSIPPRLVILSCPQYLSTVVKLHQHEYIEACLHVPRARQLPVVIAPGDQPISYPLPKFSSIPLRAVRYFLASLFVALFLFLHALQICAYLVDLNSSFFRRPTLRGKIVNYSASKKEIEKGEGSEHTLEEKAAIEDIASHDWPIAEVVRIDIALILSCRVFLHFPSFPC